MIDRSKIRTCALLGAVFVVLSLLATLSYVKDLSTPSTVAKKMTQISQKVSESIIRKPLNTDSITEYHTEDDPDDEDGPHDNNTYDNTMQDVRDANITHVKCAICKKKSKYKIPADFLDRVFVDPPRSKDTLNESSYVNDHLREGLIPPDVHYFFCGTKRWFEFKHYLSVVSSARVFRPDNLILHLEAEPAMDTCRYNLWLDDLRHDLSFFDTRVMSAQQTAAICGADLLVKLQTIASVLNETGGVYVSENTWMLQHRSQYRNSDLEYAIEPSTIDGYIIMHKGLLTGGTTLADLVNRNASEKFSKRKSSCMPVHHLVTHSVVDSEACVTVKGGQYEAVYPMQVWEGNDTFQRLTRKLFYGTEVMPTPKPSYDTLVPNIGHMIWIGGGEMDYVFFLSLLSLLYVLKVDVVYIHGEQPPRGVHWEKLQTIKRIRDRVKLVTRNPPDHVYEGAIEPWYRALMSDLIRVDLMIKYGGVYTDTDAIWVKPLSYEDRGYDAVATFDWVDWSYPYPDSVNFGVSYGKRNAPFWGIFRKSMRHNLYNKLHGFTGVMMPYKLLEKYPQTLRIDKRLGVICYFSKCHPLWDKDYHNIDRDHTNTGSIKNWKEDVHAFHWTHPNPEEYNSEATLRNATGMFAEIGKFVLESAGLW